MQNTTHTEDGFTFTIGATVRGITILLNAGDAWKADPVRAFRARMALRARLGL